MRHCYENAYASYRLMEGNPDSRIQEIFAGGIPNTENFCRWNPEYGQFLLVGSEILAFGIRNAAQDNPESL